MLAVLALSLSLSDQSGSDVTATPTGPPTLFAAAEAGNADRVRDLLNSKDDALNIDWRDESSPLRLTARDVAFAQQSRWSPRCKFRAIVKHIDDFKQAKEMELKKQKMSPLQRLRYAIVSPEGGICDLARAKEAMGQKESLTHAWNAKVSDLHKEIVFATEGRLALHHLLMKTVNEFTQTTVDCAKVSDRLEALLDDEENRDARAKANANRAEQEAHYPAVKILRQALGEFTNIDLLVAELGTFVSIPLVPAAELDRALTAPWLTPSFCLRLLPDHLFPSSCAPLTEL